ncbi:MAG: VCBS repeat-containing protein [Cyclobacteriaceae bacterium]|nr:VCBS repeat-containing protein [Cyclobacteriaceae bacterium]
MKRLSLLLLASVASLSLCAQSIFGTTSAGGNFNKGTVYSMNLDGSGFTVLHHFNQSDGNQPQGRLTRLPNGRLMGVTYQGGDENVPGTPFAINNGGVVFSINSDGSDFQKLYSFNKASSGFYEHGEKPAFGLLLASDGKLYGATTSGGSLGGGVLYRINQDGSNFQVLLNFGGPASVKGIPAEIPGNRIIFSVAGGNQIYKYSLNDPNLNRIPTVADILTPLSGNTPGNTPIIKSDGNLYGTTLTGGTNNRGFLYRVDLSSPTNYTTLASFPDHFVQYGQLMEGQDGLLYGTFSRNSGTGGVFRFDPGQNNFSIITETGTVGPSAVLSQLTNGALITYNNSSAFNPNTGYNNDYIFRVENDGSNLTVLRNFGVSSAYGFGSVSNNSLFIYSPVQQSQSITFSLPASLTVGSLPYLINGTSSSGMDLLYVSSNPSAVKVVNGNSLLPIAAGSATITAYQLGNYEYLAADPVVQNITIIEPPPLLADSLALVQLYTDTNGPGWTNNSNWLTGPVDTWYGITVSGGRITGINLDDNNLAGSLPAGLGDLTALTTLLLGSDPISGVVPDQLGNLTQLSILQINFTSVAGSIPPSLGNLTQLTTLRLNNNSLTGLVPPSLSTLVNLVTLDLSENFLAGGFYSPGLSGTVPSIFSGMTQLQTLNLAFNSFSGDFPDISGLANLQQVLLNNNQLTGLPPLSGLSSLMTFDVTHNLLSFDDIETNTGLMGFVFSPQGEIPVINPNLSVDYGQPFSISISTSGSANQYQWYRNGAIIPGAVTNTYTSSSAVISDTGSYFLQVTSPVISNLTIVSQLINVTVNIPTTNASDSLALVSLYNSTNGSTWLTKNNWLTGNVSTWHGIIVENGRVTEIKLNNNQLTGTLPDLSALTALTNFSIANNQVAGGIPVTLGNLIALQTLNLANNRFTGTIPNLSNLTNLQHFSLATNTFLALQAFPAWVVTLSQLQTLNLQNSRLQGAFVAGFSNLSNLRELNLSLNAGINASGISVEELGALTNLEKLYLNGTNFSVTFPNSIAALPNLQVLDINGCNFTALPPAGSWASVALTANISNNLFDFGDLEPLTGAPVIFINTGQKNFNLNPSGFSTKLLVGDPFNITPAVGGTQNNYQWFLNGSPVGGATAIAFDLGTVELSEAGTYRLEVTNNLVTGITLVSSNFLLSVVEPVESRFAMVAGSVVINDVQTSSHGGYWADIDNDGDEDLFVGNNFSDVPNFLYENLGNGTFQKIMTGDIVTIPDGSRYVSWGDYDNDGYPDLIVGEYANLSGSPSNDNISSLYRNNGDKTFARMAIPFKSDGGLWADDDKDGDLDLFLNGSNSTPVSNKKYQNNGDGTFTLVDAWIPVTGTWYAGWMDIDNDGDPDYNITPFPMPINQIKIFRNTNGTFTEENMPVPTGTFSHRGSSWADIDGDGDLDLFAMNQTAGSTGVAHGQFYINNGSGNFTMEPASNRLGVPGWGGRGSAFGDADNDGDIDLFLIHRPSLASADIIPQLFLNDGNGQFTAVPVTEQSFGFSDAFTGLSLADYDNDGALDLFIGSFDTFRPNYLYRNQQATNGNNWIKLKLVGVQSNKTALGARVDIYAEGNRFNRQIMPSSGLQSQNSYVVHSGLGTATQADSVVIHWPSGNVQRLLNLLPNQLHIIDESVPLPTTLLAGSILANVYDEHRMKLWLGDSLASGTLLFRKSRDGATEFHNKVDNQGKTITIVKNNLNKTFGGFSTIPWTSNNSYYSAPGSFLFSFSNQSKHELGGLGEWTSQYAVYHNINYGPTFGGGHDLFINGYLSEGYTNLGHTYNCSEGTYSTPACTNSYAGSFYWTIEEVEVFRVWHSQQIQLDTISTLVAGQLTTLPEFTTAGLPIHYVSSNTSIIEISGSTIIVKGIGSATITASQPGNENYSAANPISWIVTTIKGDQTISFQPIAPKEVGDLPFYLEATSSSGRPVTYQSDNLAVALVTGDQVRVVGSGTATITSTQPGDEFFNAAVPVTQTITVTSGTTRIFGLTSQGGMTGTGTAYSIKPDGTDHTVLYNFAQLGQYADAAYELGTDGYVYGSTQYSANGVQNGTLFKFKPDFSEYYHLKEFGGLDGSIVQSIALSNDGYLYGNTMQGGQYGLGTLFRIRKDGTSFQVLHHYTFTGNGKIILGSDGKIYGHSYHGGVGDDGVVYRLEPDGSLTLLHDFQPSEGRPSGQLTEFRPGVFAGVGYTGGAFGYGSVFRLNANGTGFEVLKSFSYGDGHSPQGRLLYVNGYLYGGTTGGGSTANTGVLFRLNPETKGYQVLHELAVDNSEGSYFNGGLAIGPDGFLYGGTFYGGDLSIPAGGGGTIFRMDTTGVFQILRTLQANDGYRINREPLRLPDGKLLFSTYYNDTPGEGGGSIITLNPDGTDFKKLVNFGSTPFGKNPEGTLAGLPAGKLAGVARYGGSENKGTVFTLDHDGFTLKLLHDFNSASSSVDAQQPSKGLLLGSDGVLYGATSPSSSYPGYVYRVALDSTGYSELATLDPLSIAGYGDTPSQLIELATGELVGTSFYGGPNLGGYIYKVNKGGSGYSQVYQFTNSTIGLYPAAIMQASDGRLYASCYQGGDLSAYIGGFGSVVSMLPDGTDVQRLFTFSDTNGKLPYGELLEGQDGRLYGTASFHGGNSPSGIVFSLNKNGSDYTMLSQFNGSNGNTPVHGLAQTSNGQLYGTTFSGGTGTGGTLFSLNPDGSDFVTLRNFDPATGANPYFGKLLFYNPNGRQPQSIAIDSVMTVTYGTGTVTLNATASSGLPVLYYSSDPTIASVNGNALTILKIGTVTITAVQPGNYDYLAATPAALSLTINKADQVITFNPIPSKTLEDADFELQAFSSAHLWLTYTSSDTTVVKLEGKTVKLVGAGTATITASQAGNQFYNAPASISQDLLVEEPIGGQERLMITMYQGSANGWGSVVKLNPDGSNVNVMPFGGDAEGTYPTATLVYYDGAFFGTTQQGGRNNLGTIYRVNADGSEFYTLYHFDGVNTGQNPWAKLMAASDGYLYGTTVNGGVHGAGTVFRIYPDGTNFLKLFDFSGSNGTYPYGELLEGQDGLLYGTTYSGNNSYGTIFQLAKDGSGFATLHNFNLNQGAYPYAGLVQDASGRLYGTTYFGNGGGNYSTVYSINPDGTGYTVLANLNGSNGNYAFSKLIIGQDGLLYGTTHSGGTYNTGTIFRIGRDGSNFAMLYSFGSNTTDSRHPGYGQLFQAADGKLYGTTLHGGSEGVGTLYSFDPITFHFTQILSFTSQNGFYPYQGVITGPDGYLYGSANSGGTGNAGVVYKVALNGSGYQKLKEFRNNIDNGSYPLSGLEQANGEYFGTTINGGINDRGVIYKLNRYGKGLTKVFDFGTSNLWYSYSSLTSASDGRLYGTTNSSLNGRGGVFRFDPVGSNFLELYSFPTSGGGHPYFNKLMEGNDGKLYGGLSHWPGYQGALYSLQKDGSNFSFIHGFNSSNGAIPRGDLVRGPDGALYGLTVVGGAYNNGSIYKINTDASLSTIYNFDGLNGAQPNNGLILGLDGRLYGTAYAGGSLGYGVIFRINTDGSDYTKIYEFTGANGAYPFNGLAQGADSTLYGATWQGGMYGNGVAYKIKPDGTGYERLLNLSNQIGYYPYSPILVTRTPGREQTITFPALAAASYGDAPTTLTATASSGLPVTYVSSDTTVVNITGNLAVIKGAGNVLITAKQPGNGVYDAAPDVVQPLTINKATLIATASDTTKIYGQPNPVFKIRYTGFVNSDTAAVLDIAPVANTIASDSTDAGMYAITLNDGEDNNYSFTYVNGTLTITPADQVITFSALGAVEPTDPPFLLEATASSGLPVGFTTSDSTILKINGTSATIIGAGEVTITATQPGNANYNPAPEVSQTITIEPALDPEPQNNSTTLVFNPVYSTQMTLSFNPGDGENHLVIIKPLTAVDFIPDDGIAYSAQQNLVNGQRIVSVSRDSVIQITGLQPGTLYHVAIFEYNGTGSRTNYKVPGADGNRSTLALPNVYVTSPVNNATGLNVTLNVTSRALTGAITYTIQLSPVPDFSSDVLERSGGRTQNFTGLMYTTTYFARVRTNLSPDFGLVTQFTTGAAEQFAFVTNPANNATGVLLNNLTLNVTSSNVIGALQYTIELNLSPGFDSTSIVSTGTRTRNFSGLAPATTYYTRVRTDLSPNWGQTRQFTTAAAAQMSFVVTPGNNATNVSYNPNITVNNVGAASYTIQLSPDEFFTTDVVEQTSNSRTMSFVGLSYNTLYHSRVSTNLDASWGPTRRFTTNSPLTYSYTTNPANGATNVNMVTNVTANNVPGATQYTIELSTTPDFSSVISRTGPGRTYSFTLLADRDYYTRVQTNLLPNQYGQVRTFRTGNPVSLAFVSSPANGSSGVPTTVNVTANNLNLSGATLYTIELNPDSLFNVASAITKSGNRTQNFAGLQLGTTYYTRVQTNLAPGQWGQRRSFTTVSPAARVSADWMVEEDLVEISEGPVVTIYPNPFRSRVIIDVTTVMDQSMEISVFDLSGKRLIHQECRTNVIHELDGSEYAPGVYLVRILLETGVIVRKIVKE